MTNWTPSMMGKKGGARRTRKKIASATANLLAYHAKQRAKKNQLLLKLK